MGTLLQTPGERDSDKALFAYYAYFYALAVVDRNYERYHTAIREIGKFDRFAGLVQRRMPFQAAGLQMGPESSTFGRVEGQKNQVIDGDICCSCACRGYRSSVGF